MLMVISMNITIRELDDSVFRRFKAKAVEEGLKVGQAITQAMEIWIKQKPARRTANLLDVKPFDWGKGTERTSTEIDEILHEGKP
jgi:hypothetical protein